jgi:hypothetical protein
VRRWRSGRVWLGCSARPPRAAGAGVRRNRPSCGIRTTPSRRKPTRDADEALALALATGKSAETAAREAGISSRTVWRRRKSPDFRARIGESRKELFDKALGLLCGGLDLAAAKLRLPARNSTNEAVILAASRGVIDYALRLREHGELETRLAAPEARARDDGKKDKGDDK